ncbi:MAG: InlB B-repeat-containing protein, partial [Bifidobacteriaceae bacterium]|nr:InlB B-repeat-containing protein [Bifidobacteriaceae bacterium]
MDRQTTLLHPFAGHGPKRTARARWREVGSRLIAAAVGAVLALSGAGVGAGLGAAPAFGAATPDSAALTGSTAAQGAATVRGATSNAPTSGAATNRMAVQDDGEQEEGAPQECETETPGEGEPSGEGETGECEHGIDPVQDSITFNAKRVEATGSAATTYQLVDVDITLGADSPGVASLSVTIPSTIPLDETKIPTGLVLAGKSAQGVTRSYNYTVSIGGKRVMTADEAETALAALRFVSNSGGKDTGAITVSFSADPVVSWEDEAGNRHFYQTMYFSDEEGFSAGKHYTWYTAYNLALTKSFNGLRGYLATISSTAEDAVMAQFVMGNNSLAGGVRARIRCFGSEQNPTPDEGTEPAGYDPYYTGDGLEDSPGFTKAGFDCSGNPTSHPIPDIPLGQQDWLSVTDAATAKTKAVTAYQRLYETGTNNEKSLNVGDVLATTVRVGGSWYWAGGPTNEAGRAMRGQVFYRLPRASLYNSANAATDYATITVAASSGLKNTCGTVDAYGWCTIDAGKVPGANADGTDSVFTNWNRQAQPDASGGENAFTLGADKSSNWNDRPTYDPIAGYGENYTVEFSEGWEEQGGGSYSPPLSDYSAVVPTAIQLKHVKEGTTVALGPQTVAPSSGVKNGVYQGSAQAGALDLPGYSFSRAFPASLAYNPNEIQTITYYYTKNPVADSLTFDIKGEFTDIMNGEENLGQGIVYELENVQVDDDYGPIRAVSVSYPSTLDMTGDDSAIDGFITSMAEGNGVRTWTYMAGDEDMSQLEMGLDYAHVGVTPERFRQALEVLTFSPLVSGIETPGSIQVTMADFAGTAGSAVEETEPIPQPIWTYYLPQGGSVVNRNSYLSGAVGSVGMVGTSTVSANVESAMPVDDWVTMGFSVDGGEVLATGSESITYGPTRHTLVYYYAPSGGYKATFDMGGGHEGANPFPDGVGVAANGTLARPSEPHDPGYRFLDWYAGARPEVPESESEVSTFDFGSAWESNRTIYAWWDAEDDVSITFDDGTSENLECDRTNEDPEASQEEPDSCEPTDGGAMVAGTMPDNQVVPYDSLFEIPNGQTPMREGFEFAGWYADDARVCAVHEVDAGTAGCTAVGRVDAYVTMTAHWSAREDRIVQFSANTPPGSAGFVAETLPAPELVPFAARATDPSDAVGYTEPVAYGYAFTGWSTSASGTGVPFDFDEVRIIAPRTTLYAQWEQRDTADVTFTVNAPGGTAAVPGTVPENLMGIDYSQTIPDTVSEPIIEGYRFTGWYDSASGGIRYELGALGTRLTTDVDLYATWTLVSQTLTVTFAENKPTGSTVVIGGTMPEPQEGIAYNATVREDLATPVIESYHFAGWVNALDHTGIAVYPGITRLVWDTENPESPTQQWHATWELESPVAVTFDARIPAGSSAVAGTVPTNLTNLTYNTLISPSTPIVEGYRLDGWHISSQDETTNGTPFDPAVDRLTREKFSTSTARTIVLVAAWTQMAPIDVVFNPNPPAGGGAVVASTVPATIVGLPYHSPIAVEPTPVPLVDGYPDTGFRFAGWFTAADGGSQVTFGASGTRIVASPVYAHWTPDTTTYSITWSPEDDGASRAVNVPTNNQDLYYATTLAAPNTQIARKGYRFGGWWTGTQDTGTQIVFTGPGHTRILGDTTLHAAWTEDATAYTVFFDPNASDDPSVVGMPDSVSRLVSEAIGEPGSIP